LKTAVVILNYNGVNHLETFLPSVVKYTPDAEIWVADNGSSDCSVSFLQTNFPTVNILRLEENLGFAGGYNHALRHIHAGIYVLLNSDVEVSTNWLPPLIERLSSDELLAACQPKIRSFLDKEYFEYAGAAGGFLDKWGYPFCRGRLFRHCERDEGQYDIYAEVFWATGACLAIKSKLFHEENGFDPVFFAHMEEIDLCWRLKNNGYKVACEPASVVYHLGGGTLNTGNPHKTYLNFRNSLLMLYKNLPAGVALRKILIRLVLDGFSGINYIFLGKWKDCLAIIKAHFSFYRLIGSVQKHKKANERWLWPHSFVYYYFLRRKRKFSELPND
jgi:GT2 family glycosyltransferase